MNAPLPVISAARNEPLEMDARAVKRGLSCVHCGLCLPACPTYVTTGLEAESPRGRIQLMLGLAEGKIDSSPSVRQHLDQCLDCRACETACPSGVIYHELIEAARSSLAPSQPASVGDRLLRGVFFHIFTRPTRLKLALLPARLMQRIGLYSLAEKIGLFRLLPGSFAKLTALLPPSGPLWPASLKARNAKARDGYGSGQAPSRPSVGSASADAMAPVAQQSIDKRRIASAEADPTQTTFAASISRAKAAVRVGFFTGCVGSVMCDGLNAKAADLLTTCGAEVIVPTRQACCGAIHEHNGAHDPALSLARSNIDAFCPAGSAPVDFIISTAAGCGAMLREYDVLLRDDPAYAQRAIDFVSRVRDITEVLLQLGLPAMPHKVDLAVTYHDACHLAHGQKVTVAPRLLLQRIAGLKFVPLPESDMCCGAAGTYNLTQPVMAAELARRKLQCIRSTGATIVAAGNVGCSMHLQAAARDARLNVGVVHPVELLHRAMFGD